MTRGTRPHAKGASSQRKISLPLAPDGQAAKKHVREEVELSFPLDVMGRLPEDVKEAVAFRIRDSPQELKVFRRERIQRLKGENGSAKGWRAVGGQV